MARTTNFLAEGEVAYNGVSDEPIVTLEYLMDRNLLAMELKNSAGATAPFSNCVLQLKDHPDGAWYNFISGADWTAGTNPNIRFCTTGTSSPQTLPDSGVAHMHVRTNGAYAARLCITNAGAGTATGYICAKKE